MDIAGLLDAILLLFTPLPFALMVLGVVLGIVVGAIPGLTGSMLITLTLPLTFYMQSVNAIVLLVAMYVGAVSGALIGATLLRIPGTPASIMTTFDGFPMARDGNPGRALGLGISASFFGGVLSWFFLWLLTPQLARFSIAFGPFELFSLVLMALVLIASVSEGSFVKGLISGLLGIMVALPGIEAATGEVRLTFGWFPLLGGLQLLPVLLGIFAVSQILEDIIDIDSRRDSVPFSRHGILMSTRDWLRNGVNLVRSSLIGTWVGILPGVGASVGSIMAYTTARNMSRTPERFGTGTEEGIVASEAANNATIGGALIPLIALGIPGSVIDAILIGALMIHNIQPGPMLFNSHPELVNAIIGVFLVANFVMFAIMLGAVGWIARLMAVPRHFLFPAIMMFCVIGSFALGNRMFDVWVMLFFGVVGLGLRKARVPLGPFVIGFVLAPIAELELRTGLQASAGSLMPLVTRPLACTFMVVSLTMAAWPFYRDHMRKRASNRATTAGDGTVC